MTTFKALMVTSAQALRYRATLKASLITDPVTLLSSRRNAEAPGLGIDDLVVVPKVIETFRQLVGIVRDQREE